ncbi:MAG: hypothetical protein M3R63_02720 [Actinomycetota bacterium]|nr:hypothetical protein [Actinomycetota bacterium]
MEFGHLGRQAWQQIKDGSFAARLNDKQIAYAERFAEAAEYQGNVTRETIKALFTKVNIERLSKAERYFALNVLALCWKHGQAIKQFLVAEFKAGHLRSITESGGAIQIWTVYSNPDA